MGPFGLISEIDWCWVILAFVFGFLFFWYFVNSLSIQLLRENSIVTGLGDILLNFLCLLKALSIIGQFLSTLCKACLLCYCNKHYLWWWIVFAEWLTEERHLCLISSQDHCQRFSPFQISDMLQADFLPVQNLSSDFVKWSCAVVITTTPRYHYLIHLCQSNFCDDFNIFDKYCREWRMYLVYIYDSFICNLFLTFHFFWHLFVCLCFN